MPDALALSGCAAEGVTCMAQMTCRYAPDNKSILVVNK